MAVEMSWIKIGFVGLILIEIGTGCRAKHEATENTTIDEEKRIEIMQESESEISVIAAVDENVVLEHPVIEIHDREGGGSLVIRGEKLIRGRQGVKEIASESKSVGYNNIEDDAKIAKNQEMTTEGKVGINKTYLIIGIVIFILLIGMIKKKK